MQKYTYICWIHTDAIIIKTPDDNDTGTNDARRKEDAGRLLYKIFYLSSLFVSFERVVPSLHVRVSFPYYISSTTSTLLACLHWLVELHCPELNSSALYYLQTPTC